MHVNFMSSRQPVISEPSLTLKSLLLFSDFAALTSEPSLTLKNLFFYFLTLRLKPPNQKINKSFSTSEKARISSFY